MYLTYTASDGKTSTCLVYYIIQQPLVADRVVNATTVDRENFSVKKARKIKFRCVLIS